MSGTLSRRIAILRRNGQGSRIEIPGLLCFKARGKGRPWRCQADGLRNQEKSGVSMMSTMKVVRGAVAAAVFAVAPAAGWAQTPAEFYKGKNVDLMVGYSAGGGYDVYARMIARYMGKHIPGNPTVIVKNMDGAGSLRLANALYNQLPKDGTVFGTVARGAAFDPLLGNKAAQFDASKFSWIGSANDEVSVCVAWHTSGITKIEETFDKELVVGGT